MAGKSHPLSVAEGWKVGDVTTSGRVRMCIADIDARQNVSMQHMDGVPALPPHRGQEVTRDPPCVSVCCVFQRIPHE